MNAIHQIPIAKTILNVFEAETKESPTGVFLNSNPILEFSSIANPKPMDAAADISE